MSQNMQYTDGDIGPCYMTADEQIQRRLDIQLGGTKETHLTKAELITLLKDVGVTNPIGDKKNCKINAKFKVFPLLSLLIKYLKVGSGNKKVLFKSFLRGGGWTLKIFNITTLKKVNKKMFKFQPTSQIPLVVIFPLSRFFLFRTILQMNSPCSSTMLRSWVHLWTKVQNVTLK